MTKLTWDTDTDEDSSDFPWILLLSKNQKKTIKQQVKKGHCYVVDEVAYCFTKSAAGWSLAEELNREI